MGVKERPFCRFWIGPTVLPQEWINELILEQEHWVHVLMERHGWSTPN
jgi:hypothetical protein